MMYLCRYLSLFLFVLPILLNLLNFALLAPPTPGTDSLTTATRALQVDSMGHVRLWHINQLQSMRDFAHVFSTLGKRAQYVNTNLKGEYSVQRLPLGVWGAALSYVFQENQKRTMPWTGQRFVQSTEMTDSWGDNTFTKTVSGQRTRGQSYFTTYDEASHYDGGEGSIVLDYRSHGGNGWSPASFLMGELRCFNQHLCVGLTGAKVLGGPKNGVPYVLYRAGTKSGDNKAPTKKYVRPKTKKHVPTKMKKHRIDRKKKVKEMKERRSGGGDL